MFAHYNKGSDLNYPGVPTLSCVLKAFMFHMTMKRYWHGATLEQRRQAGKVMIQEQLLPVYKEARGWSHTAGRRRQEWASSPPGGRTQRRLLGWGNFGGLSSVSEGAGWRKGAECLPKTRVTFNRITQKRNRCAGSREAVRSGDRGGCSRRTKKGKVRKERQRTHRDTLALSLVFSYWLFPRWAWG